jgi:hypothetical protein
VYAFWETVIEPVLLELDARTLVEVGCAEGLNTKKLLRYCQDRGGVLHAVDPAAAFDAQALSAEFGDVFRLHRVLSLDAIPSVLPADAVLLDGDHNWYTVFHELRLIQEAANRARAGFPVTFLHDIDWPYGRRDLYYDPDTIPPEHRQPFGQGGLLPGDPGQHPEKGINLGFNNALQEGGSRNGVLTAVEDFLEQSEGSFEFVRIPGFHGLGIVHSGEQRAKSAALRGFHEELWNSLGAGGYFQRLEAARLVGLSASQAQARAAAVRAKQSLASRVRSRVRRTLGH